MEISVLGCHNCPFSYEYDMSIGYGCKIIPNKQIKEDREKWILITPEWCPLKEENITIKLISTSL